MAQRDWYFICFGLTAVVALSCWILAIVVYRNNRKQYLNRSFALMMLFLGLWVLAGFAERLPSTPNDAFTLWVFRWAYANGTMLSICFLLFGITLYLDRAPKKVLTGTFLGFSAVISILCFSPLIIHSATLRNGVLVTKFGPLYPLNALVIPFVSITSIYLIAKKWSHSAGIDRARSSVVLLGFVIFVPFCMVSALVLPVVLGSDASSGYAFITAVIPVGFLSYAIVRLRLLDTRIILRRTTVLLLTALVFSVPLALLFVIIELASPSKGVQYLAVFALFILVMIFAQDVMKRLHVLSARLFFSGLYDEVQLLEEVSDTLSAESEPNKSLEAGLSHLVAPLGVDSVGLMIPPGVVNGSCWYFKAFQTLDGPVDCEVDYNAEFLCWLGAVEGTVVTEEVTRWPRNEQEENLGRCMAAKDLCACLPVRISEERIGYLLIGNKINEKALSSTDISLLEKTAERIAVFIDNYGLSSRLASQLNELQQVYSDLHQAYDFKSEIIQVASHEFRTPITVIDGFVHTLVSNWDSISEEDKAEYLTSILVASKRLVNLTDKFLDISKLENGNKSVVKVPTKLSAIVQTTLSDITDQDIGRILVEGNPELYISCDPEHLRMMLENLVENALRFSPPSKPVMLKVWRDSTMIYIQVQDFGKGIPLAERERVFEPFVRLETLENHSRGMGLGLHIVRLLSSRLGIEVEIDSGEGRGTTVTLCLGQEY